MEHTKTLETERLLLRKFTEQDTEALFQILSDKEVNTFLPMFPLQTMEEAKIYLKENYLDFYEKGEGCRYGVCLKHNNLPIGYIHVSGNESHDFGYGLRKEFWNQGIMTEAAMAVVGELKNGTVPFITATHDRKNPGSGAVMRKIGMTYQYSYEELWQPKNILVTFRMYQLNFDGQQDREYRHYWNQYPVHFVEKNV